MSEDLLTALVELGLSGSEAKVYLAVARRGVATTKEIAVNAGKERSNTHHLLLRLQELGLVEATLDSPTRFKPVEPREAVDQLFNLQTMRFKRLEETKRSVLTTLPQSGLGAMPNTETVSVIKGRVRTYLRVMETLAGCSDQVSLLMSANGLVRLSRFRDFIPTVKEKASAGVRFRVITEITRSNVRDIKVMSELAEVRHVRNQSTNASIYDMRLGSVALAINDALDEDVAEHVALWSNGESFVKMLATFFDSVWFLAAPAAPTMRSMGLRP